MASLFRRDLCRSLLSPHDAALFWSRIEAFGSWRRAFSGKQQDDGFEGEESWDRIDRLGRTTDAGSAAESRRGEDPPIASDGNDALPFGFGGGSRVPSFRELRAGITHELHRDEDFVEDSFWEPQAFDRSFTQEVHVEGGSEGDRALGDSWNTGSYAHSLEAEEERLSGKRRTSDGVRSETASERPDTTTNRSGHFDRRKGIERDAEDSGFGVLFDAVQTVAESNPRQPPRARVQAAESSPPRDAWKSGSYPHSLEADEGRFSGKRRTPDQAPFETASERSGTHTDKSGPLDRRNRIERDAEDSGFDVLFEAVQTVAENNPQQPPRARAQTSESKSGKKDEDLSDEYSLKKIRKNDSGFGEGSFAGIGSWKPSNADISKDKLGFQGMVPQGNEFSGTKAKSVFPRQGFLSRQQGSAVPAEDSDISFTDTTGASTLRSKKGKLGTSSNEFDLSDFSFKNIARRPSEFDFISIKQPAVQREPRQAAEDDEELSIFEPSFKVLSDTFSRQAPGMKSLPSSRSPSTASGLFSILDAPDETSKSSSSEGSTFFTSPPSKAVKLQTAKEYTYEELGKKLQQLRSPSGLGGALGSFFQEFGERLLKLRKMEEDGGANLQAYQELRESLSHLLTPAPKPDLFMPKLGFSLGKLALLNRMGMGGRPIPKITYLPPNDHLLEKYFSQEQMSSKDLLKIEIHNLIEEYQVHEADTGSPQVQVAILTAKINNLNRHFRENHNKKRDKHSRRGLNGMVQSRKRLLWYLRRRDWDAYCNILTKLRLPDIIHEKLATKYR